MASTIVVKAPVYMKDDETSLAECYRNSLNIAAANSIMSIAFPPISVGKKCFPKRTAAYIAVSTVQDWIEKNPGHSIHSYLVPEDLRIFDYIQEENAKK